MSSEVTTVKEIMALAKQLPPKDRARVLWRIALTLENHLNTELIERETPISEMCGRLDSATPWDKASVIWWLARVLEGDLAATRLQSQQPRAATPNKRQAELPNLEQDLVEMRREAWANFPREELYQ